MVKLDYRAVSSVGATVATFGEIALARKWARENAWRYPGLRVEAVTITTNVVTVYTPRPRLSLVRSA